MRSPLSPTTLFLIACGLVAGWLVHGVVPETLADGDLALRDVPYAADWRDDPREIHDAHWLDVPWLYADFDLQMDVELGEGVTFDILMRRVDPRITDEGFEQFDGRFTALRLSADRAGEPWLDRDRLLLGDRDAAGAELAPGRAATVWIRGRGRLLSANVAGRPVGRFLADDEYGSFLFIARGGKAVIQTLRITSAGQPHAWMWSLGTWLGLGALAGLVLRAVGLAFGEGRVVGPLSGLLFVVLTWLLARMLRRELEPLAFPDPGAMAAVLGLGASIAAVTCHRWLAIVFGLAIGSFAMPTRPDESSLDALFGPDAGSALIEAHAQQVRGSELGGIHDVRPVEHRVFLLGGQLLYGLDAPERHLEMLLAGDLRAALGQPVDVPCLPTVDGYSAQQWAMFERFYEGYRPDVIVFGVSAEEGARDPRTGRPRSFPGGLRRTIAKARAWCEAHGASLVLFAGEGVAEEFRTVLEDEAGRGVPLVAAVEGEDRAATSHRLAEAIAPLMR